MTIVLILALIGSIVMAMFLLDRSQNKAERQALKETRARLARERRARATSTNS